MTRAEVESIMAQYAPLEPDDDHCLQLAMARLPAPLAEPMMGAELVAVLDKVSADEAKRIAILPVDYGQDGQAEAAAAAVGLRVVDYRRSLQALAPLDLAAANAPELVAVPFEPEPPAVVATPALVVLEPEPPAPGGGGTMPAVIAAPMPSESKLSMEAEWRRYASELMHRLTYEDD